MIEVKCFHKDYSLFIKGHAGAGPKGEDLVCAGASALTAALEHTAWKLYTQGKAARLLMQKAPGDTAVLVHPVAGQEETVDSALETLRQGFRWMAREYPEYVKYRDMDK